MRAVPIRETKETGKFSQMVKESLEPIVVTKNGYDDYVVIKPQDYASLKYKAAMADLYSNLLLSERQGAQGAYTSLDDFRDEVCARYGL